MGFLTCKRTITSCKETSQEKVVIAPNQIFLPRVSITAHGCVVGILGQ